MAARRLIMVLLLLLGVSVAAAAIAPERRGPANLAEETSTTTTAEELSPPPAKVLERQLLASTKQPETIRADFGARLVLSVRSPTPTEIAIDPLGLIANADPQTPAQFDLLLGEPEDIAITDASTGEVVGRIQVGMGHSEAK